MNRIDRLFAILLLVQRKRRMRALDPAQAFEISERTINRLVWVGNQPPFELTLIP